MSEKFNKMVPTEDLITWAPDGAVKIRLESSGVGSSEPMTVPEVMKATALDCPDLPALKSRNIETGIEKVWSWSSYYQDVRTVAKAFIKLGLQRFEGVCIIGMNSPEWVIANVGSIFAGGLATGVYPTNGTEACKYILEQSNCSILVVEDQLQLDKVWKIRAELPNIKQIVQYSGVPTIEGVMGWQDLLLLGATIPDSVLEERLKSLRVNQCCTLVFTSGTTGNPKGVMLSHDNITFTAKTSGDSTEIPHKNFRVLSYLPLSHVAATMMDIHSVMYLQGTTYFADRNALKTTLVDNLKWCRPTAFCGVPRVWEKIMDKMLPMTNGKQIPSKIVKELLGLEQCKSFWSGAAPIEKKIVEYYLGLDIKIQEIYGMSETSGPHTMQLRKDDNSTNTVGKTLPSFQSRLVEVSDSDMAGSKELWMWGRHVMMGYIRREDATKKDMTEDGWMKSGDLCSIDEDGFHYIVGRKKDLLITAGGENVAPQPIHENVKTQLPGIISQVFLVGDRQKFISSLLTLSVEVNMETLEPTNDLTEPAKSWCRMVGSDAQTVEDILDGPDIKVMNGIQEGIDKANKVAVSNAQKIQKWMILPRDFSLPGGELTPTMKVKRAAITKMYQHSIDNIYKISVKKDEVVSFVRYQLDCSQSVGMHTNFAQTGKSIS